MRCCCFNDDIQTCVVTWTQLWIVTHTSAIGVGYIFMTLISPVKTAKIFPSINSIETICHKGAKLDFYYNGGEVEIALQDLKWFLTVFYLLLLLFIISLCRFTNLNSELVRNVLKFVFIFEKHSFSIFLSAFLIVYMNVLRSESFRKL